ncbi:hypothetical protein ACFW9L_12095 [Streptomyces sp. NPDC059517]|uniref:hypothetical protein n=1 Tax=Streptomyces sp. NPDC059517 TaxID=3346855 RepID=UPI0036AD44D0
MDSATAAALVGAGAGIIGAAVGAGSAVFAARVTAVKGAQASHQLWLLQGRRDAYSQLSLQAQNLLEDVFRFRQRGIEGRARPVDALDAYTRLTQRIGEIRAAHVAAEIAGPAGIERHTGRVLRSLLCVVEAIHPDALLQTDRGWNLPDAFEDAFSNADRAVSDMSWCARKILSTPGIDTVDDLRPPLGEPHD